MAKSTVVSHLQQYPIQIFDVDPVSGALSPSAARLEDGGDKFYTGSRLFLHPFGRHLVTIGGPLRALAIDDAGDLTLLSKEATVHRGSVDGRWVLRMHPGGRFLYVFAPAHARSKAGVFVFRLGDGAASPLFEMLGNGHEIGCDGRAAAFDPAGDVLYCSSDQGAAVQVVDVQDASGTLTVAAKVNTAESVSDIEVHPSGELVYVLAGTHDEDRPDWSEARITAYRRTASGRRLTPVTRGVASVRSWLVNTEITSDGDFLYALDRRMAQILAFAIGEEGELSELGGFRVGGTPSSMVIDPESRFVYVASEESSVIASFSIGAAGQLVPMPNSPVALDAPPVSMALGP